MTAGARLRADPKKPLGTERSSSAPAKAASTATAACRRFCRRRARRTRCSPGSESRARDSTLSKLSNSMRIAPATHGAVAKKAIEGDPVLEGVFRSPPGLAARAGRRRTAPIARGSQLVAADPDHHAARRAVGGPQPLVHRRRRLRAGGGANHRRQSRHRRAPLAPDGPRTSTWTVRRSRPGGSCSNCCGPRIAEAPQRRGAEQAAHSRRGERGVSVGIARRPAALDERRGRGQADPRL